MTRRAAFKQADVARAVKGIAAAGLAVGSISILPDGTIVVYAKGADGEPRPNPLDRLLNDGP